MTRIAEHSGKVAIVTGGSSGIGRSIASHLIDDGVGVILTYRTGRAEAEAMVAYAESRGVTAVALALDIGEMTTLAPFTEAVRAALWRAWDRDTLDYLVHNAGIVTMASVAETTEADFDRLSDVLFKGVFFLTQRLMPLLADGGSVVTITGGLTRFTGPPVAAYAAMKGAVEVFSRHLAAELGPRGITVNIVAPGPTNSDLGRGRYQMGDKMLAEFASQSVFGRIGQPDDIGAAVTALLSDANAWVTGQRIEVTGGVHL